ncbi:hypothetical protein A2686_03585 [Candidatus Woesebacteria bacterium RIFCSPHIGHO2_01_FULL_38_10]|nr:MAG: hypothetical protein A2686_03585 [Candidatus Woesebacteria bacterium RIFCSPHIGHO2_01_FULL_38_10]
MTIGRIFKNAPQTLAQEAVKADCHEDSTYIYSSPPSSYLTVNPSTQVPDDVFESKTQIIL